MFTTYSVEEGAR